MNINKGYFQTRAKMTNLSVKVNQQMYRAQETLKSAHSLVDIKENWLKMFIGNTNTETKFYK